MTESKYVRFEFADRCFEVRRDDETFWFTQEQAAEFFERDRSVISKHVGNIFAEGELQEKAVCARYAQTASDGKVYGILHYSLELMISVGYRISGPLGTKFRQRAIELQSQYEKKGFLLNEARLHQDEQAREALFAKIREIRTSDRAAYRKITDLVATSYDYDPSSLIARTIFARVQNIFHYAIHGHTAAELIVARADADKPNMGLCTWSGKNVTKADVTVAKNYLEPHELMLMQTLAEICLVSAEGLCKFNTPMSMQDWSDFIEGQVKLLKRPLLVGAGNVSAEQAGDQAVKEYMRSKAAKKIKASV